MSDTKIAEEMVANHNDLVLWSIAAKEQIAKNISALEHAKEKIVSLKTWRKNAIEQMTDYQKRLAELEAQLAEAKKLQPFQSAEYKAALNKARIECRNDDKHVLLVENLKGIYLSTHIPQEKAQQPCQSEEFLTFLRGIDEDADEFWDLNAKQMRKAGKVIMWKYLATHQKPALRGKRGLRK